MLSIGVTIVDKYDIIGIIHNDVLHKYSEWYANFKKNIDMGKTIDMYNIQVDIKNFCIETFIPNFKTCNWKHVLEIINHQAILLKLTTFDADFDKVYINVTKIISNFFGMYLLYDKINAFFKRKIKKMIEHIINKIIDYELLTKLFNGVPDPCDCMELIKRNTKLTDREKKDLLNYIKQHKSLKINTCSKEDLIIIKYIGEKKAEHIIKSRPYKSLDDIVAIRGIGKYIVTELKKRIVFE